MKVEKANFDVTTHGLNISVPLSKVNEEARTVSGFATLDNVDTANDVITFESSKRAFAKSRARIREMHQPVAVGTILDFKESEFYDKETDMIYRGIYVTAYISKGAEDTWQKVLDGTLSAFSVKGRVHDYHVEIRKDGNGKQTPVRYITDWDLDELSLVDNPGNQLANIMAISKSADGVDEVTGMVTEIKTENIFWCKEDEVAKTSPDSTLNCDECAGEMKNIGWYEEGDDTVAKIRDAIAREEGVELEKAEDKVAEETEAVEEAVEVEENEANLAEEAKAEEAAAEELTAEEETNVEDVEKAAEVEESNSDAEVQKSIADLTELVKAGFSKSADEVAAKVSEVTEKVEELAKNFNETVEGLKKENAELREKFESFSEGVEKRVDAVVAGTAGKKSGDLGGSTVVEKRKQTDNVWSGSALTLR